MAGLTCAALLAKRGMRVALFEQHDVPGGYCSSFESQGYTFDVGVDSICGLGPQGRAGRIMGLAGIGDHLPRVHLPDVRGNVFPDESFVVPESVDRHVAQLQRRFPTEAPGIKALFDVMEAVARSASITPPDRLWDGMPNFDRHPELQRWRRATFLELIQEYVDDPIAWAWLSERVPYVALPPSQVSAVTMCVMVMSYFRGGAWRVRGGIQQLPNLLVEAIRANGGTVELSCPITEILVENGAAAGVRTEDGRAFPSRDVVCASDLTAALSRMLPADLAGPSLAKVQAADPSLSLLLLYIGTSIDLSKFELPSSIGVFPSTDVETAFEAQQAATGADEGTGFGVEIPTLLDPSVAPPNRHTVIVHYPTRFDSAATPESRDAIVESVLDRLEATILPGLRSTIEVQISATPRTLERYTWNRGGAPYGFAQSPERYRLLRDLARTPIPGFHVAGHWTDYGGGVPCAIASGYVKANLLSGAPQGRVVPGRAAVV